jgi:hypothetical protein
MTEYIIISHLLKVFESAIDAGYQHNRMITAGVDTILDVYGSMTDNHIDTIIITCKLVVSILPTENSYYDILSEIARIFQGKKELALALFDCLLALEHYRNILKNSDPEAFTTMVQNPYIRMIFTDPETYYDNDFSEYFYIAESDSEVEDHNEIYQNLAPSKEAQMNRLKNELAISLCEECLMPIKGLECDC